MVPDDPKTISRRQLFQVAGGVTLLALVPKIVRSDEAPTYEVSRGTSIGRPPVFTAVPYLQPGPAGSRLKDGEESIVVAWQTDTTPAKFELRFGETEPDKKAAVTVAKRAGDSKQEEDGRFNYAAQMAGLKLGHRYKYRVRMDGQTILEGYFTTRQPRGKPFRFVSFGDNSYGEISDRAIAYQAYRAKPDMVMNAGDNVYESGLDNEYARYFFPVYNADEAGPRLGAPLLRSVPFYTVIANHDVHGKSESGGPAADFQKNRDALGLFTNMYLPLNGLASPYPVPTVGEPEIVEGFRQAAGARFPVMANYSFDYGDAQPSLSRFQHLCRSNQLGAATVD